MNTVSPDIDRPPAGGTVTTLNAAARTADSALGHEYAKHAQIARDEQALSEQLAAADQDMERLRLRKQDLSSQLADKGRERTGQEQRITAMRDRMEQHAAALVASMGEMGVELDAFIEPQPGPLEGGPVPQTGEAAAFNQQVAANGGQPTTVTYPVPLAYFENDPTQQADLGKPGEAPVARTGGQPTVEDAPRKRRGQ
jgi:hypothetical protein